MGESQSLKALMWSGRNGVVEKAVVGRRIVARKRGMMFMMEGVENHMMMMWGMGRSVAFVVHGMVKSMVFVVWEMTRWVVLAFELVFVLRSVVVIVSAELWRAWGRGRERMVRVES